MKRNFDRLMQEQLKSVEKGTPLLLHSCCAPCSSACLERLKDVFKVTVLFYNPNIDEDGEYAKRKAEQIRFLQETGWADFLDCDHDKAAFEEMAKARYSVKKFKNTPVEKEKLDNVLKSLKRFQRSFKVKELSKPIKDLGIYLSELDPIT